MQEIIRQSLITAIVAFLFEYIVYLRIYKRSKYLEKISLAVAPTMAFIAVYMSKILFGTVSPASIFLLSMIMELPLSIKGYKITPDENILNRLVVAGVGITISFLIARQFFV